MKATLNQVKEVLPILMKANIVPFLHSSPAQGKSSIVKQLAKKYQLELIDVRLTEMDSLDFNGLPSLDNGKASYKAFDIFPLQDTPLPKGKKGFILLLDEFSSGLPSVQSACYKLILDRQVGQYKLHDKCKIIACSNLSTDNAIVFDMSSALVSRFAHFYIELSNTEWQEWAVSNGISPVITSFLSFKPECLYTFNPDSSTPYASPRTWSMVNQILSKDMPLFLLASLLGEGVAREFHIYIKLQNELPNIQDILDNPGTYPIPYTLDLQWAVQSMVVSHIHTDIDKCVQYLQRLPSELHLVSLREIKGRHPELLAKPCITAWISQTHRKIKS